MPELPDERTNRPRVPVPFARRVESLELERLEPRSLPRLAKPLRLPETYLRKLLEEIEEPVAA